MCLSVNEGMFIEAYHTQELSYTILSVRHLQKNFEELFSNHISSYPVCYFHRIIYFTMLDELNIRGWLYPLEILTEEGHGKGGI